MFCKVDGGCSDTLCSETNKFPLVNKAMGGFFVPQARSRPYVFTGRSLITLLVVVDNDLFLLDLEDSTYCLKSSKDTKSLTNIAGEGPVGVSNAQECDRQPRRQSGDFDAEQQNM
ncbi:hypothetical protein ElyMa_006688000 [Elysia marginata]|uniref:Uncharacterized protein n=1 Tax=Elysia marginata TaxID=1093978 RepID=A0AAV4IQ82_9GAST|nr:hypothetical protein ElyMa_006688000 [Elysia marginata]